MKEPLPPKTSVGAGQHGFFSPPILLVVASLLVLVFLLPRHDYAAMWAEGLPEFQNHLRGLTGLPHRPVECAIDVGRFSFPLGLNAYIGAAYMYMYAPSAYLWLSGIASDPFVYRYTGIALFLVATWLFYYLCLLVFGRSTAIATALMFLSSPTLLYISLLDSQTLYVMLVPLLASALLLVLWRRLSAEYLLFGAAFFAGVVLTTRLEGFIWPFFAVLLYGISGLHPGFSLAGLRTLRVRDVLLVALGSVLGASTLILYTVRCPSQSLSSFLLKAIPNSTGAGGQLLSDKITERFGQFWDLAILQLWPRFGLTVPNVAYAVVFAAAALVVAYHWTVRGKADFPLFALLVVLPLSVLTTGFVRPEHLQPLLPLSVLIVGSALSLVNRRTVLLGVTAVVLISNNVVTALDWRHWRASEKIAYTMLNQSDPVLLTKFLQEHHAGDVVVLTNVGFQNYVDWVARGTLETRDVTGWEGDEAFVTQIKAVLSDGARARVFAARAREHERVAPEFSRTSLLEAVLAEQSVPYNRVMLQRNGLRMYDVITVDAGVTPINSILEANKAEP